MTTTLTSPVSAAARITHTESILVNENTAKPAAAMPTSRPLVRALWASGSDRKIELVIRQEPMAHDDVLAEHGERGGAAEGRHHGLQEQEIEQRELHAHSPECQKDEERPGRYGMRTILPW